MPSTFSPAALLLAAALAAGATGCATVTTCAEPGPAPVTSEGAVRTPYRVQAADGTCLQAFAWRPRSGPVRGAVVIVHGIRDHASRYDALAEALTARGFAVYAQDHRGHGGSGGDRQRFDSVDQLVADVDLAVRRAGQDPGVPVFLFGHSLGGLVSVEYTLAHPDALAGVALSGAALKLPEEVGTAKRVVVRLLGAVAPSLPVQAVDDSLFVRDPAAKAVQASDPQIDHGDLPARSAVAFLDGLERVQGRLEAVAVPLLILHGTADRATSPEGSRELQARARSTDKTLDLLDGLSHDLLHEPERERVIREVADWMASRLSAAPR